jgi:hypothetical protein
MATLKFKRGQLIFALMERDQYRLFLSLEKLVGVAVAFLTAEKGCLRGPETREGRDLFGE